MENLKIKNLYNVKETIARELLEEFEYPWEALAHIGDFILRLGARLSLEEYNLVDENVWIHKDATIYPTANIYGPVIICKGAEIRPGAFIRGNAIVGENSVVGNSTELKNVIIFNCVQVPHYNYVGDSILGFHSHMGAGSITSNVKSDKSNVTVKLPDGTNIETGLRKFGAMLGDYVEVGCNSVLNPGSVIGSHTNIYPLSMIRGFIPKNSIVKTGNVIVSKED